MAGECINVSIHLFRGRVLTRIVGRPGGYSDLHQTVVLAWPFSPKSWFALKSKRVYDSSLGKSFPVLVDHDMFVIAVKSLKLKILT